MNLTFAYELYLVIWYFDILRRNQENVLRFQVSVNKRKLMHVCRQPQQSNKSGNSAFEADTKRPYGVHHTCEKQQSLGSVTL
jgi:hypothetical protein